MEITPLRLSGTYEIKLAPIGDDRGYFMRVYDENIFREYGLQTQWVQENQSKSKLKHTIRGFHFQRPPHAETKLVRVVAGAVLDVFVDLRSDSPTYGEWDSLKLTTESQNAAYIPKGFGHAFCSLVEDTIVLYKVDSAYAPASEGGILWNDETLNVEWPTKSPHISSKDQSAQTITEFKSPF